MGGSRPQSKGKIREDHGIDVPERDVELDDGDPDLSFKTVQANAITAAERGEISVSCRSGVRVAIWPYPPVNRAD